MSGILRKALEIGLLLLSPVLLLLSAIALAACDVCFALFGRRKRVEVVPQAPSRQSATVVIPNWNGRDLLEKFLPSVVEALAGNEDNEIMVVDNASSDGSAEYVQKFFPQVRVLAQTANLGFGGGSNAGLRAAKNRIVILLNNDMRVEPDFLAPLLEPFSDPLVFSVSCQIFFSDPARRREETGLSEVWWEAGRVRASHRDDPSIHVPFPCAYPGGGSSAFDRDKFLELGGFDELLRPFYYEDTDIGLMAWKRGWKLLYQPASIVFHEHRGTIGKKFSPHYIEGVLKKNIVLYCWKNIHQWDMLAAHFTRCFTSSIRAATGGQAEGRYTATGLARAFLQLPEAILARWRARSLAAVDDAEAFRRPLGGYYRDRFDASQSPVPDRLNVLFASPYPIEPPVHGGAVFMKQTLAELAGIANVHLVCYLDRPEEIELQKPLTDSCATAQYMLRSFLPPEKPATLLPHAVREFYHRDFAWLIHKTIFLERIDAVQLEYTILGQFAGEYKHIPCFLFEHDIFFQSLWRGLGSWSSPRQRALALLEYIRMLRYELQLLGKMTRVQTCSLENTKYLLGFEPALQSRIDSGLRSGIDTKRYRYVSGGREPDTMLFVGSFQHVPNLQALNWFANEVLPRILAQRPSAMFVVVGSNLPESLSYLGKHSNVRLTGRVPDIREPLEQYAVFVCPILSGSGVRVKLLEAFAAGIPVVSTTIGAEGLSTEPGDICELADSPKDFADSTVKLLSGQEYASGMALRARQMVVRDRDAEKATRRLVETYRQELLRMRPQAPTLSRNLMAEERV
jgi:GT2 family glycosyltransferase/glycosyltransferase involved in cell wall biosynthesis